MNFANAQAQQRGFSFVETLVTAAIITLVFGGLFAGVQVMVQLIGNSKAKAGATALAVERIEYIRSLPYNSIGTDGGVPSGTIPQNSTTTLNGIQYAERVLIEYVDDDADGFGGSDSNGILADYKRIKVEYSWSKEGKTYSHILVTSMVPIGIETTEGGGTIRVNVFDSNALPVEDAVVRFYNDTATTTIDTVRYTNSDGIAYLSGAPAIANYEITANKTDFSTDGTYTSSSSNPNPTTPPIAVVESAVSTMNFQIDELSDLLIKTVSLPTTDDFTDEFTNDSLVSEYASTTRNSNTVELVDSGGVYSTMGTITSTTTSPAVINRWYSLSFNASTTVDTSVRVSLYYQNGASLDLVPDTDLPGNSVGFISSPIDLQDLDAGVYDTLALGGLLETTDSAQTPQLFDWSIDYVVNEPNLSAIPVSVRGAKTIGTDALLQPVYKYTFDGTTDASGELSLDDIEFDIYSIEVDSTGYDLYEVCPTVPHILTAGVSDEVVFTLGVDVSEFLRVRVEDASGDPVSSANVRLENVGVDESSSTNLCGQTHFTSGLYAANDYTLTVSAPGYTTEVISDVSVTSSSTETVFLNP